MLRLTSCLVLFGVTLALPYNSQLNKEWEEYKQRYRKSYSPDEEIKRQTTWADNWRRVQNHNREAELGLHSFTLGINEFSDMTQKEFNARLHGYRGHFSKNFKEVIHQIKGEVRDLPKEVNWKDKGWVSPVGNQLQCGSCWAFTAVWAVEGQNFNKTGKLVPLSAQELMDCSEKEGNRGCEGGMMTSSYEYVIKNKGIDTQASYPYTGKEGKCHFQRKSVGATITGYGTITKGSELALQTAVATIGPIAVAVDAVHESFQMYKSGIYNEPKCQQKIVDHSLLVVGYGTLNGTDYWLMKNSWGTSWGMDGYIMMSRNKNNQCGVATMGSYPIA